MNSDEIADRLRGRGGRLQSAEFDDDMSDGVPESQRCGLVEALLYLYGWGELSLPSLNWVGRCAMQAIEDAIASGSPHEDLEAICKMGSYGEYPGNLRRDLFRHFAPDWNLPWPTPVATEALDPLGRPIEVDQYVLNPAQMFESIWQEYPGHWNELVGENPADFWNCLRPEDPKLDALAALRATPGWEQCYYPFIIHGDGGTYTRKTQQSILIVSCKSMLSEELSDNLFPGFVLPSGVRKYNVLDETADELWESYVHLLNACAEGRHPRVDHRNRPWPPGSREARDAGKLLCEGKFRLIVFCVAGDMEFYSNELRYPHFNSNFPCLFCPAGRGPLALHLLTDCRRDAGFKANLISIAHDRAHPCTSHPISDLFNFSRFLSPGDWMHSGSLGSIAWFLGGALTELWNDGPFVGDAEARRQQLWEVISVEYDNLGSSSRLTALPITLFYRGEQSWSVFSGKAGEAISLVFVLHELCVEYDDGSERDNHRRKCFESLCFMFSTFKASGFVLSRADADAVLDQCERFLVHYNWLTNFSVARGRLNYNLVGKHHAIWHIAYHAKFLNPRKIWCMEFEDFVGVMLKSAKGCMSGTPLVQVGRKVLENFLLVLRLRLRD